MRIFRAGALLPPLFLWLGSAPAAGGEEQQPAELEHVQVTATRRAATEFDVSAAVTHVDSADIQAETPGVLAEMLRGLPGAFFQQTTPGQGIPIIRGLKGSQVLHLVDGMRLNNAFFRDAPNQYLGLVDAYAVERVEVVRGAAGTLYGADAMGGVVNVITPEPVFTGAAWQQQGRLYAGFGSADDGWVGRASTRGGRAGLGFSAGVSWQDRGDRRTGSGETVRPSAYRSESVDLKLVADIGDRSDLMFSAQALEQPSTPRVDEMVPGYGQDDPSSSRYYFEPNRRGFLHARYRLQPAAEWLQQIEVHLARQVITDDRLTQDFGSAIVTTEANESVLDGLTLQFDSPLPGDALLTWGLEYYADEVASSRSRRDLGSGDALSARSRFPDGSSMDSAAAYLSGEWHLGDRLTYGAGLRYSRFDIRLPASPDVDAVELTPSDLTGDLRLLYALTPELHLVANAGRGFRPPNIFDLAALGPRPGNRFNVANPGLQPESVWSYDLGLKSSGARWRYEIFAFYLDYRDKITSVATGEVTPGGRTVVRSENRNRLKLYGLEAGLRWRAGERLELFGVLNYTRGEEQNNSGQTVPGDRVPPLNGKLGAAFDAGERWRLEAYGLFAGPQDRLSPRDLGDPRIDPDGTPGWGTLNLLVSWQASEAVSAGLKLENLGDIAYREHGSGIDAPGRNIGLWVNAAW